MRERDPQHILSINFREFDRMRLKLVAARVEPIRNELLVIGRKLVIENRTGDISGRHIGTGEL